MTTILWRKELRTARPYLALSVILGLVDFTFSVFTEYPDQISLAQKLDGHFTQATTYSLIYLFLSFSLASVLLMRDYDDGVLEFLDSLPTSRAQAFVAKYTVAVAVIAIFPLLELLSYLVLHALGRDSLDPSFHWGFLAGVFICHFFQILIFAALAFLLAYLRRFAWVLLGVLFWLYKAIQTSYPQIARLNPFDLTNLQMVGTSLQLPWNLLGPQLLVAAGALLGSLALFAGWGDALAVSYHHLRKKAWGNAALIIGAVAITILAFSIVLNLGDDNNGASADHQEKIYYPSWAASRAASKHFDFLYPANRETAALALAQQADSVRQVVQTALGDTLGQRIFVDMTQRFAHYAGTAKWLTINLQLAVAADLPELRATFGHELTHVYIDALSNRRLAENFNATRFFHEGLASYVEYQRFRSAEDYRIFRLVAAAIHARREVDFKMLADNALLAARHDHELAYPFGERFIQALVNQYGEKAPLRVVQAFANPDLPHDLDHLALWYQFFQAAGYSLERVLSEFYRLLDADAQRFGAEIRALPRLKAHLEKVDEKIQITLVNKRLPEGWRPICRLRAKANTPYSDYLTLPATEGVFTADRAAFGANQFDCQLGLAHSRTGDCIYEPWFTVRF